MRSQLERLDSDTLSGLLQMYETALEDLNATGDRIGFANSTCQVEIGLFAGRIRSENIGPGSCRRLGG
jgi:hypothetical protein